MTPREIVSREVMKIPQMRIPFAALIVARIFEAFAEYGYTVNDEKPASISKGKSP